MITVEKASPALGKNIFPAVVVRQARAIRRPDGTRLSFEDNAAVIMTPEGELKGTEIRVPVAKEAAQRWPRVGNLASTVIYTMKRQSRNDSSSQKRRGSARLVDDLKTRYSTRAVLIRT